MKELIGQAFGILAVILTFVSYQCKGRKSLLTVQTLSSASTMIQYLLLGATTGFALNIVCILRNLVFYFKDKKPFGHPTVPYILAVIMGIVGAFSWNGLPSLLIIPALMVNTVFISGAPQPLRKSILLTSSLILIYNIFNFAIGGIINEAVAITSSIIGICRFKDKKRL